MADVSGNVITPAPDIDLDNIEVEILIICKTPAALNSSCAFLIKRGWPTCVLTDIGKAIEYIAEKKPDFILVSLSHTSQSVTRLPDLITQTFNLPCIGFVETSDAGSAARLTQSKMRFKITGQPSGPAIHRTVRKILADRFNIQMDEKALAEAAAAENTMRLRGSSGTAADGGVIIQKSAVGMTGNKGAQVIKGGESQVPETHSGPTSLFFKKPGAAGEDPETAELADILATQPVGPRRKLKQLEGEKLEREASGNMLFGEILDSEKKAHVTMAPSPDLVAEVKKSLFGEAGEDVLTAEAPAATEEAGEQAPPSTLQKAVEGALGRLCQSTPGVEPVKLEEITQVAAYPVESATQPGYLVIVWQATEQSAREEFLRGCEHEIQNAFNAMKVEGRLEPGFWVHLPPVFFTDWARQQALFNFTFAHQKREVGIAFFQTEKPIPKPTPPKADHGMYSVKVEQISTEFPVTFKAFIHFVNNNRFFLYLRNGRVLQPEQKVRLQKREMKDFYMKKVDLENLRQYMATSYLGGLVKRLKKAA